MAKVALVGAGNVELTRKILSDLMSSPELAGSLRVALHDIDPGRLATAELLSRRLNAEAGAGATIEAGADREVALAGADFVVCQIDVGGYEAARADFEIPHRYGVRQTVRGPRSWPFPRCAEVGRTALGPTAARGGCQSNMSVSERTIWSYSG